jgi:hypothetical protein
MLRSMVAVIVGFMVMFLVVIALTLVMVKTLGVPHGHPSAGYLSFNAGAAFVASLVGGYVTGTIAAERRVRHGYLLGIVMLLMAALSYVHYRGSQPAWYQAAMVVIPPLFAVMGAKIAERSHLAAARR